MNRRGFRRVVVPRFRRGNLSNENVDIDDLEAQREIDEELKSVFIWSSDLPDSNESNSKIFFDKFNENDENKLNEQFICDQSILTQFDVQSDEKCVLTRKFCSMENVSSQMNFDENSTKNFREKYFQLKTTDEEQIEEQQLDFNSTIDRQMKSNFNLNSNEQIHFDYQEDFPRLTIEQNFLVDRSFLPQMIYSLTNFDEEFETKKSLFVVDEMKILYDCQMKTKEIHLNLCQLFENEFDEKKIFVGGETISLRCSIQIDQNDEQRYSLSSSIERHLDLFPDDDVRCQWSIEVVNETNSFELNFIDGENVHCRYSIEIDRNEFVRLSIDEILFSTNHFDLFKDFQFDRFRFDFIRSFIDETRHSYSFIDSNRFQQHFGEDLPFRSSQWTFLQQFNENFHRISFDESFECIYSVDEDSSLNIRSIISFDDEMTQRMFRKYRCKHFSMKSDWKDQIDYSIHSSIVEQQQKQILSPNENLDEQIQNDFNEQIDSFRDPIENYEKFNNETKEIEMDFVGNEIDDRSLICLRKDEYLRPPPPTSSRLRKEIGFISFNAAEENPEYKFNQSNKRFVHLPQQRKDLSIPIYDGFDEFLNEIRSNPTNYFRSFDHLDLRPLLSWYINKQHLFSSTNNKCLKHPNFICRRLTLVKILSNLYCDSQTWKLFVFRFKGQFYLSLANKEKKQIDQMTKDEYAGFHFESIFTSEQPNSTRLNKSFPLKNPQKQFHSVQFWNFGRFNLLYSNEIDAQIHSSQISDLQQNNEKEKLTKEIEEILSTNLSEDEEQMKENLQTMFDDEEKNRNEVLTDGYVEMKCTKRKIFYRDENKLQTLNWWAQSYLANIQNLIVGYKNNEGLVDQIDFLSQRDLISKFLSKFDLKLKYCLSYLYSFLELIERIVTIDDLQTIHVFAYIPQPLEMTGDDDNLPSIIPFRYDRICRSNVRHRTFLPQFYLEFLLRSSQSEFDREIQSKSIDEEMKKRYSHRGRTSCPIRQTKQSKKKINKSKSIQR